MADIDSIIAGVGGGTRADFTKLPSILDAYYKGRDQAYQQEGRDLFANGVPTGPDGQPDFAAMGKALFQHGDIGQGTAVSNLALQRQQLQMGQDAASQMGRLEGGAGGSNTAGIVSPPSLSSNARTPVAAPLNRGGVDNNPQGGSPQEGSPTLLKVIAASGIPNDQIGAAAASIGRQLGIQDPNTPLNLQDPQVRNVLVPAIQQLKRMGIGQTVPQGQPAPPPQVVPQQAAAALPMAAPQPNPQANQGTFGAPVATPTRGAVPTGPDPEVQKQIAVYTAIASNPAYPKSVQEAAQTRLKALQSNAEPTGPMKEYDLYRRQGGTSSFADYQAENEAKKTGATEEAKLGAAKYQTLVDAGTKAQQEIPQLEMLQGQMNDPNFYSGVGEKYNLLGKRLQSAAGISPDAAVPQEMLRKVVASSVLGSFGALKGLGPIRVAEMKLAQTAAAAPENSIPANKLLVEIQKRTYQRQADVAEMAQNYKEQNGTLDAGFDKQVTAYFKQHPMFSDAEIQNFHKAIGDAKPTATPVGAPMRFNSPSEVHQAVATGKLRKGDTFTDPNGVQRIVP